ncbi:MAG: response regulator transcription factor [bacterium]|nr:response regulator transcription factor [bacterium]
MNKVLVVEDEELIRSTIKLNLKKEGYNVSSSSDSEGMMAALETDYFDLILLDIMMPGMSGDVALKTIREQGINTPVIMVTAKNDIGSKANAFDYGADDYISKPFDMIELLMRVKAVIRRSQGARVIPSNRIIQIGNFNVDLDNRTASTKEGEITLSEKETKLLFYFNTHHGETLKRVDILEEVWGMDVAPTPRTIDNFIVKFRRLFEEDPENSKHFISVRSKGYRFLK